MTPKTNIIKEFAPGVFGTILWCPAASLLQGLLDPRVPYVLVWNHSVGPYRWEPMKLPIVAPMEPEEVLSRFCEYDFVLPTARFLELLPRMRPAIRAVQLKAIPPDFLTIDRIRGPERFRVLQEFGGWHVLLDTPANDFGVVNSPSREVVEQAIKLHKAARGDDPFSGAPES